FRDHIGSDIVLRTAGFGRSLLLIRVCGGLLGCVLSPGWRRESRGQHPAKNQRPQDHTPAGSRRHAALAVKFTRKHGDVLENSCASIDASTLRLGYFAGRKTPPLLAKTF